MVIEMAIDVMYIEDVSFLHSIDQKIKFRALVPLGRRKKKKDHTWLELFNALKIILRFYNAAEVRIGTLHGNQEFKGKFQEAVFDEFGIKMNLSNPNEHVPDIKRANRLLEERFRVHYYRMPFKVMPTVMIEQLALSITDHITWFPAKGGISQHYSPYTILSLKVRL